MYKYPPTLSNHPFEDALRAAAMGTDNYCPECGNPTHHTRRFARIPPISTIQIDWEETDTSSQGALFAAFLEGVA